MQAICKHCVLLSCTKCCVNISEWVPEHFPFGILGHFQPPNLPSEAGMHSGCDQRSLGPEHWCCRSHLKQKKNTTPLILLKTSPTLVETADEHSVLAGTTKQNSPCKALSHVCTHRPKHLQHGLPVLLLSAQETMRAWCCFASEVGVQHTARHPSAPRPTLPCKE